MIPPIVTAKSLSTTTASSQSPRAGEGTAAGRPRRATTAQGSLSAAHAGAHARVAVVVDPVVAGELRRWRANAVADFAAMRHRIRRWDARGDAASVERGGERVMPAATDVEGWRRVVDTEAHGPRLATVLRMHQRQIVVLLEVHRRWLVDDELPLTRGQGRWIYALLAGLDRCGHGNFFILARS